MKYTMISIACLGLLQIFLAIYVSFNRFHHRISQGTPDDVEHPLHRAIVAHRNACEFTPILCILMLQLQYGASPAWTMWCGPALVLTRTCQALGLIQFSLRRPNPLRFVGTAGTYVIALVLVGVTFFSLT